MTDKTFEYIENIFEFLNFIVGIFIVIYGLPFLNRLRFSLQKKAIGFFIAGVVLFALAEIIAVLNIKLGSNVFALVKELAETGFIISTAIALFFLKQSDQREISRLRNSAYTDALTGLYN